MRAHRTDPVSLTSGLIFLAVAAWWLVAKLLDLTAPDAGWFVAGLLIVVGVLGLLGALRAGRASTVSATASPADPSPAAPSGPDVAAGGSAPAHPAAGEPAPADPTAGEAAPADPAVLPPDPPAIRRTDPDGGDREGDRRV